MVDSINIALDPKILHRLTRLTEVVKEPVQELAKRLIEEGIECEVEEIALADVIKECEAPDAETIDYEDFKRR